MATGPSALGGWRQAGRREAVAGWLFILPAGILLVLFLVWPALQALLLSFTDYQLLAPLPTRFIGAENYRQLLGDGTVWQAVRTTLTFAALAVPVQSGLALALALGLNLALPGRGALRAAFFCPVVVSTVVAAVIWSYLYHPTQGLFNRVLTGVGLPAQPFLSSSRQALPAILGIATWQNVGFYLVIFLAGLQQIAPQLYEAAAVDGANGWQQFRFVTVPQLRRTTSFVVVVATIYALRLFTEVYVTTKGGPFGATRTVIYLVWEEGVAFRHTGYAAALAVLFFLLVLAITLLQRRLAGDERGE
jgi:fructooligosaccharide transport system permease protein